MKRPLPGDFEPVVWNGKRRYRAKPDMRTNQAEETRLPNWPKPPIQP